MIIAWVVSLILLLSSLVGFAERMNALELISLNTLRESQRRFIAAEKNLLACEQALIQLIDIEQGQCQIQSGGKNQWLITTLEQPVLEVLVYLDIKTGRTTRLNWRQDFE
jgi:hypothetical protein